MIYSPGKQVLLGSDLNKILTTLYSAPKIVPSTTYTLSTVDDGLRLVFTNGSAVTVTVPIGFGVGFECEIIQYGAGTVTLSAASGVTVHNRQSHTGTAGQYAQCSLFSPVGNNYILAGDTA